MNKIILTLLLGCGLAFSSCSDEEAAPAPGQSQQSTTDIPETPGEVPPANNNADSKGLKDVTTSHQQHAGAQRGSNVKSGSVNGQNFSQTVASPRGRSVRNLLLFDEDESSARVRNSRRKKSDQKSEKEPLVWFIEELAGVYVGDDFDNSSAFWFFEDGTYDVYDWLTDDYYWGYWYISEDGEQIAFDIDSEFEEVYNVAAISDKDLVIVDADGSEITLRAYDVSADVIEYSQTKEDVLKIIQNKYWGVFYADFYDQNGDIDDDMSIIPAYGVDQSITHFNASGTYDSFDYEYEYNEYTEQDEVFGDGYWELNYGQWSYDELNHALIVDGDVWYISWIDANDIELFYDDEEFGTINLWLEDVEYWYEVNITLGEVLPPAYSNSNDYTYDDFYGDSTNYYVRKR